MSAPRHRNPRRARIAGLPLAVIAAGGAVGFAYVQVVGPLTGGGPAPVRLTLSAQIEAVLVHAGEPESSPALEPAPGTASSRVTSSRDATPATASPATASLATALPATASPATASPAPVSAATADRLRGQLLAEYTQVSAIIGAVNRSLPAAGDSTITALRAQEHALPSPTTVGETLTKAPDTAFSGIDPTALRSLVAATTPLYDQLQAATVATGDATHATTARPHVTTATGGETLGVQTVPPASDTPDENCGSYPGGGLSPEDHQRALDGQDSFQVALDYAQGIARAIPADLLEVDVDSVNPLEVAAGLVVLALQEAKLAYDTTLEQAEVCFGNNTQNVAGDLLPDADALYATGDTVLALDQQVATLADDRTRAIEGQITTLQQVVEADNALTQTSVGQAQVAGDALNASLTKQLQGAIEAGLASSGTPVADFLLPSADGGYLDASPVGVQSVVHTLLAAMDKTGAPYDPAVLRDTAAADAALAAGRFKAAYADYRQAYQELGGVSAP